MSCRAEVEAILKTWRGKDGAEQLALDLSDEVDALRAEVKRHEVVHCKAPNCGHMNCCAEAYDSRCIITELLALLEPGEEPREPMPSAPGWKHQNASIARKLHNQLVYLYDSACKIAGRPR